eukprot:TRINITY_DN34_c0_g1_i2.p1 TRINITY_DN34_c0_g1~~TRINITY_DN34_c0_g1_i2.p1  ORF type:complete len:829 (-),score=467.59 TRINITY_DN34_c0_g1_i2:154-2640(-)
MSDSHVIRLKPLEYIHVLDNNTNVTTVVTGPKTFTRLEHEQVVSGPSPMLMIPPRHYCVIANPVIIDEAGKAVIENGSAKLRYGDEEIRVSRDPFPLFPGEMLVGKVTPLQVVAPNAALRLRCIRDFTDDKGKKRVAGDEWLFVGPATYPPAVEVQVVEVVRATIIKEGQALKLRARRALVDSLGKERHAGEQWLVRTVGAYLPNVDEELVETVNSITITDKKAIHLRARQTYTDSFDIVRKSGQEWLITIAQVESYIPDVYEEVVGEVKITTLNSRQYCVVLDPVDEKGNNQYGKRLLKKGEDSFFLLPGERLEKGIQSILVLDQEEALLLRATEQYTDNEHETGEHKPGDRWMLRGPRDFIPPVQVEIIEKRRVIPLDENEGIYVRDIKTGAVRSVIGESYLLKSNEELWEKQLPPIVEELLGKAGSRDKTRVVTYRAPHNSAVQVYDFKAKKSRVAFGPELVLLGPDEHITVLSLSGGKPKLQDQIKSLSIRLGPDFMTDIITVETSDHARLSLQLAYSWHFDVNPESAEDALRIFSVPDFVGDACKAIASRVRGAVAGASFDDFHRNSADIIRGAVFGFDDNKSVRSTFNFKPNKLVVTNIDIQSVEPIDQRTRDSLQKSVQLAIEITTQSQEATARHEAMRRDQEARGKLERMRIEDEAQAEKQRIELLQLQAHSAAVEATGQATAEARAKAEAASIEGSAAVNQSELRARAQRIKAESELAQVKASQIAELEHQRRLNELELSKAKKVAEIETAKFKETVEAIGPATIEAIARAGPEMQAKLLEGLGIQSLMITDGNSPINLFNTANGLLGNAAGSSSSNGF